MKSVQFCDFPSHQTEIAPFRRAFEELNWMMDSLITSLFPRTKNLPISIILIGGITIGLGLVFVAQSSSLLGPPSSFMYKNADWTTFGLAVAVIGIVVCSIGLLTRIVRRPQK